MTILELMPQGRLRYSKYWNKEKSLPYLLRSHHDVRCRSLNWFANGRKGHNTGTCPGKTRLEVLTACWDFPVTENVPPEWKSPLLFFKEFESCAHSMWMWGHHCVEYYVGVCPILSWRVGKKNSLGFFKEINNPNKWESCFRLYHHGNCWCA